MARTILRDQARVLRKRGLSLNEIMNRLHAPKSTIRHWCRDIMLTTRQQRRLARRQKLGGIFAGEKLRLQRMRLVSQLTEESRKEVGTITHRELLLVGAGLYWAEGYRKGDGEFGFTNSDPDMIRFMIRWLRVACGVPQSHIHARICVNTSHRNRIAVIQKFWLKTTGLHLSQFSAPTYIRVYNKKRYLNRAAYFATLRLKVRRSVNLRRKIIGWIRGLESS